MSAQKYKAPRELTQSLLKTLVHYDPDTGIFTWKKRPIEYFKTVGAWKSWNTRFSGAVCGTLDGKGYPQLRIYRNPYNQHRLAWLYMYGKFPDNQIDHINGNRSDNRIANLRDVTRQVNHRNMRLAKNNKSGVTGVNRQKGRNDWMASIRVSGRSIRLGQYSNFNDAVKARKEAEIKFGFHPNHGKR